MQEAIETQQIEKQHNYFLVLILLFSRLRTRIHRVPAANKKTALGRNDDDHHNVTERR